MTITPQSADISVVKSLASFHITEVCEDFFNEFLFDFPDLFNLFPGFFDLFGGGCTEVVTSTFNITVTNNTIVALADDGSGTIKVHLDSSGPAHLILDVSGYFK